MESSLPDCSPACTRLQNRSSKWRGCFASAEARLLPLDTSFLMLTTSSRKATFSCPSATMSNDCTSGTPAFIMVASWREKIAMSAGVIAFLRSPNSGLGFLRTVCVITPCLRSWALASARLSLCTSPCTVLPRRSLPWYL